MRPAGDGGVLEHGATLEVVSSLHADGSPVPGDLRWGVYVTFAAADRFVAAAFAAYGVATSADGRVAALWRPSHLVGLELGVSVARAALAGEPTGVAPGRRSPRSPAVPSATCVRGRRSTARAASTSTACSAARRRARVSRCFRWGWHEAPGSCATSHAAHTFARADVEPAPAGAAATLHEELSGELQARAVHT